MFPSLRLFDVRDERLAVLWRPDHEDRGKPTADLRRMGYSMNRLCRRWYRTSIPQTQTDQPLQVQNLRRTN